MVNKEVLQVKTCELYDLLSVKSVDVLLAHKLLCAVYNVIWYRYWFHRTITPEAESVARWNLQDAREVLDKILCTMNLCDLDKKLIRYIAENVEYEKK